MPDLATALHLRREHRQDIQAFGERARPFLMTEQKQIH
jgi:hypothetical protein